MKQLDPAGLEELCTAARDMVPALDDVRRARIRAGLETRIDTLSAGPPRSTRDHWSSRIALVALAVASLSLHESRRPIAPDPPRLLVVYAAEGAGAREAGDGRPQGELRAPAGVTLRAVVAGAGRFALVGPGTVRSVAGGGAVRLRLERGVLLGDYDPSSGRPLLIEAPDAAVRITGTLFSIEARPGMATRVSIARGEAAITGGRQEQRIPAHRSWSAGQRSLAPTPAAVSALLAEHGDSALPPVGAWGTLRIQDAPAGASVWLDGRWLGRAPMVARVPAGQIALRIASAGRVAQTISARVLAGEIADVHVPLLPVATPTRSSPSRRPPVTDGPPRRGIRRRSAHGPTRPASDALRVPTGAELTYLRAEQLIAGGHKRQGRAALLELIERYPHDPRVDPALYDLGRYAFLAGELDSARRHLTRVVVRAREPALVEPSRYLLCRTEVAAGEMARARRCLRDYRADYPASPHAAEVLALLASLAQVGGDCRAAVHLIDEYLKEFPRGSFAREAVKRRARCRLERGRAR